MYGILQTCDGDGTDVNLTNIPPPGTTINGEKNTWSFKGKTMQIGEMWQSKIRPYQPKHPLIVVHFTTENDFNEAKIAIAAANYFAGILKC